MIIINNIVDELEDKMDDNIKDKNEDKSLKRVVSVLKNSNSLTVTEIVKNTKLNRSSIRIILAKLEGAEKVSFRRIGMAKVYSLRR